MEQASVQPEKRGVTTSEMLCLSVSRKVRNYFLAKSCVVYYVVEMSRTESSFLQKLKFLRTWGPG